MEYTHRFTDDESHLEAYEEDYHKPWVGKTDGWSTGTLTYNKHIGQWKDLSKCGLVTQERAQEMGAVVFDIDGLYMDPECTIPYTESIFEEDGTIKREIQYIEIVA